MRRSTRFAVSASLLLAVWLVTPLLSTLHLAFEEHTYCTQHNALEEAGSSPAVDHARRAVSDRYDAIRSSDTREASHEVCAFCDPATRDSDDVDRVRIAPTAPDAVSAPAVRPASEIRNPVPLLLAAPKISPPHVA